METLKERRQSIYVFAINEKKIEKESLSRTHDILNKYHQYSTRPHNDSSIYCSQIKIKFIYVSEN